MPKKIVLKKIISRLGPEQIAVLFNKLMLLVTSKEKINV